MKTKVASGTQKVQEQCLGANTLLDSEHRLMTLSKGGKEKK